MAKSDRDEHYPGSFIAKPAPGEPTVFVSGDCPITPGAEVLVIVVCLATNKPYTWCPDCGVGMWLWEDPYTEISIDAKMALPNGVRLPTAEDISEYKERGWPVLEAKACNLLGDPTDLEE